MNLRPDIESRNRYSNRKIWCKYGLLRRFVPKYIAKKYTREQIVYYIYIINAIPRKILIYKTPEKLFDSYLNSIYSI